MTLKYFIFTFDLRARPFKVSHLNSSILKIRTAIFLTPTNYLKIVKIGRVHDFIVSEVVILLLSRKLLW